MTERLLLIAKNFPPVRGGIERMMWHSCLELSRDMTVDLVIPSESESPPGTRGDIYQARKNPFAVFFISAFFGALRLAFKYRPDVIIGGSGLMAPIAVVLSFLLRKPSIVFLYGLDMTYSNPVYQLIFMPFIRRANRVITISENSIKIATEKGIYPEKIRILNPGVEKPDLAANHAAEKAYEKYRDVPVLLSLGRLVKRKGIKEFVDNAFGDIVKVFPDVKLLVVGTEPGGKDDREGSIKSDIQSVARENGWQENIHFLGNLEDDELEALWGVIDAFVFPVIPVPGDVEGFGMVAVEAAAHGIPTVAFREGGIPDAVSHDVSGLLVETGRYDEFSGSVISVLKQEIASITEKGCISFAKQFEWSGYGNRLRLILREVLENRRSI